MAAGDGRHAGQPSTQRSDADENLTASGSPESRHKGEEVELHTVEQMRCFLRLLLGEDWEILLILANAIAEPDASDEEVHAAQQRAVDLVRENSPWWQEDLGKLVGKAWLTLWQEPRSWLEP